MLLVEVLVPPTTALGRKGEEPTVQRATVRVPVYVPPPRHMERPLIT